MGYKTKLNLLYRVSDSGDKADKFWEAVDQKKNTLLFVKSTKGNKFGGYREMAFKKGNSYK